ncbi:hypothetical protein [Tenuifilum sp.]|jgi:hypothetical protein|uniref:hypothetical protein n=1 Tax=Tenuifilum sp. TaxID=2760880 RepID=UPI0025886E69|nr:hypothetical protein [Tenuifilum sp.]
MRRAKIYLAIVAYFSLIRRFLTCKPVVKRIIRIKQKLGITSSSKGKKSKRILTNGFNLFFSGGAHLNVGLEQGFLFQYLRN